MRLRVNYRNWGLQSATPNHFTVLLDFITEAFNPSHPNQGPVRLLGDQ